VQAERPRKILADLGVRPRKGLGQHFLVDLRVGARHIAHAQVGPSDTVLEIGPGLGVLTRALAAVARRVIAIEADRRFVSYLRKSVPEADVIEGDALKVEWPPFDVMASNLPYRISSPLTFRLLDAAFDRAVLMYQWEFARRMVARPGSPDYSRLSVGVYRRASCEILERVPRNAFYPPPKIDSGLVRLRPRPCPFPLPDSEGFDAVVDALFEHRRKTVENGLRLAWATFAPSREALEGLLPGLPFRGRRVEELAPEEIGQIASGLRRPKG
jgi:16S rRNA (adenine1518-N6/adenine1519-N6)-dimethyltransferase